MRFLTIVAATTILSLMASDPAEARRGGKSGSGESLSFVSDTNISKDGTALALCHLTNTHQVLFANVWRSSIGYALAENKCDVESYYPLSAEQVATGQQLGEIPQGIPTKASLSFNEILSGFWGLGVIGGLLALAGFKAASRAARTRKRLGEMKGAPPVAIKIVEAMCHAAKADGNLDAEEIKTIAQVTEKMTESAFDEARIRRMYDLAEAKPSDAQFASFGQGLSQDQRRLVMQAALMIVTADGDIDRQENTFIQKLAQGLRLDADEIKTMFHGVTAAPA